jgi:U3 small nucleolar RNA-associated protein 21
LNLEVVRQRNKPKEAPKQPEKAPFFLPTVGAAATSALKEDEEMGLTPLDRSRIRKMDAANGESVFSQYLRENDCPGIVETLKNLSPGAADLEIRSLEPEEMVTFVEALTQRLKTRRDFELVQTWMAVFLRVHGEVVVSDSEDATRLRGVLEEWRGEQKREAGRLSERVGYCKGLAGFLRSGR